MCCRRQGTLSSNCTAAISARPTVATFVAEAARAPTPAASIALLKEAHAEAPTPVVTALHTLIAGTLRTSQGLRYWWSYGLSTRSLYLLFLGPPHR